MGPTYIVTIKRPHRDPSKGNVLIESTEVVNAKAHAVNLARKILLEDRLPWVEVAEENGQFQFRMTRDRDGSFGLSPRTRKRMLKHGLISLAGWGALACGVIAFLLAATIHPAKPHEEAILLVGGFGWAAILLTVLWIRGHFWWWKEKMRARAWREGVKSNKRR